MSSRFVSGGTIDAASGHSVSPAENGGPAEESGKPLPSLSPGAGGAAKQRQEEWAAVTRELEEQRRRRAEEAKRAAEGGEKSLYEILQANKAAKQAAFEEANKIKNQFRALDEDEIQFLDEVKESARREEERTRREVEDGLDRFREAQRKGEREATAAAAAVAGGPVGGAEGGDGGEAGAGLAGDGGDEEWSFAGVAGRKRRRKERDDGRGVLKGVVRRRTSGSGRAAAVDDEARSRAESLGENKQEETGSATRVSSAEATKPVLAPVQAPAPKAAAKPALGLVDYGSDSDSD